MFCPKCGAKNSDKAGYCQSCGAFLRGGPPRSQPPQPGRRELDSGEGARPNIPVPPVHPVFQQEKELTGRSVPDSEGQRPIPPPYPEKPPPLNAAPPSQRDVPPPSAVPAKKNRHMMAMVLICAFTALLVLCVCGFWMVTKNQKGEEYDRQVSLGARYLQELRYDEAAQALNLAIDIQPKNDGAYLKLAEVYSSRGDYAKAADILERGLRETESEAIRKRLEDIRAVQNLKMTAEEVDSSGYPTISFVLRVEQEGSARPPELANSITVWEEGEALSCRTEAGDTEGDYRVSYTTKAKRTREQVPFTVQAVVNGVPVQLQAGFTPPALSNLNLRVVQTDVTQYPKVRLYLEVKENAKGEIPKNLSPDDFFLSEKMEGSGREFEDRTVIQALQINEKEKLNVSMVADVSGSMYGSRIDNARNAMISFLNSMQYDSGDQAEVLAFSDGVQTAMNFTNDRHALTSAVNGMTLGNMTCLYDALYLAVTHSAQQGGAKCVIAFTDGLDNVSTYSPGHVIEVAQRYSIPIYIIGIGADYDTSALQDIARNTGGAYRSIQQTSALKEIYESIYRQQKDLYMVEYETADTKQTGKQRKLSIQIQSQEYGGRCDYQYTPKLVMGRSGGVQVENQSFRPQKSVFQKDDLLCFFKNAWEERRLFFGSG